MAPPTSTPSRPGRSLALLLVFMAVLGGLMFWKKAYTPQLALDLAGGTTATLTPVLIGGGRPPEASMNRAVEIMRERVNGQGISEADVSVSGDQIIISVPGAGKEGVLKLIGTTAEMRFRQVLAVTGAAPSKPPAANPETPTPTNGATVKPSPTSSPKGRALSAALTAPTPTPGATDVPPAATPPPTAPPASQPPQDPQAQIDPTGIDPAVLQAFAALDCTKDDKGQGTVDDPKKQIAACDQDGSAKYVLDKAELVGDDMAGAQATIDPETNEWIVNVTFKSAGAKKFGEVTGRVTSLQPPKNQLAMVLDGVVISAPTIQEAIPGGQARISGSFTQKTATDLAEQLKYGSLPLKFKFESVETVSATLGQEQLRGGLVAGAIGLVLVILYSLLYYRGLGLVSVLSLLVASGLTYQAAVLLGAFLNFRLSLAGIAGLIVAIGITADSFVVYFERLRDELREGRSLRAAVERGWGRARRTILVADAVTFIASLVLYFLAVGGVKGFAFTLGLTTLIDVVVVFLFTKPLVTLMARLKFFSEGHPLSGLDRGRLGAIKGTPKQVIARTLTGEA